MEKIKSITIVFLVVVLVYQSHGQNNGKGRVTKTSEKEKGKITNTEFKDAVKKDFSSIIGQSDKSLANVISTTFEEDETSISSKFEIPIEKVNNDNDYINQFMSGSIKLGERGDLYEFGSNVVSSYYVLHKE